MGQRQGRGNILWRRERVVLAVEGGREERGDYLWRNGGKGILFSEEVWKDDVDFEGR